MTKRREEGKGEKKGLQVTPFKVAGAVKIADASPDVHDFKLVKPGGNGGFGECAPELAQDVFPNVSDGIQEGNTSLFFLDGERNK